MFRASSSYSHNSTYIFNSIKTKDIVNSSIDEHSTTQVQH